MPNPDLPAIEARAAAATEGPWRVVARSDDDPKDEFYEIGAFSNDGADDFQFAVVVPVALDRDYSTWCDGIQHEPDAAFIAAARTDVPALVAAVRERDELLAAVRNLAAGVAKRMHPNGSTETQRHAGAVEFAEEVLRMLGGGA